jgi:transcription antitermination protein NusB
VRARSRARGWALQILYAWEMRDRSRALSEILAEFVADRRIAEGSREYLFRLVLATAEHLDAVDRALDVCLTNWRLDRLSVIDRSILRLGATEILYLADVPPRVSIQEGILLAEKYGTAESPRFINGVLDALMRQPEARDVAVRGEIR